jgi:hypothetical protein
MEVARTKKKNRSPCCGGTYQQYFNESVQEIVPGEIYLDQLLGNTVLDLVPL